MTNKEAIAVIKTLCHTCEFFPKCVNDKPECFKALEMAIDALRNFPTQMSGTSEDTISRQAAIDALMEQFKRNPTIAIRAKLTVEGLQSAQPEPNIIACGDCKHWICHDRRCGYWNHGVKPLDWCCHGERRTDE